MIDILKFVFPYLSVGICFHLNNVSCKDNFNYSCRLFDIIIICNLFLMQNLNMINI